MRLEPEWLLARRIALLVADSPGRGLHRDELLAKLGMPWVDVKPSAMLAYKRGGIDFCRDYVIAPARRSRPQPELAAPFTDPFPHPLDTPPQVGYAGSMTHTEREPHDLDRFTDRELEQQCDRAYRACIAYYDTLDARPDVSSLSWKLMRAAATEQAEMHRELSRELARRTAERYAHLGPVASLAIQLTDELMRGE